MKLYFKSKYGHVWVLGVAICSVRGCPIPVFAGYRRIEAGPCPLHSWYFYRQRVARRKRGSICSECGVRAEYEFDVCEACCGDEYGHEHDSSEGFTCLNCGHNGLEDAICEAEYRLGDR